MYYFAASDVHSVLCCSGNYYIAAAQNDTLPVLLVFTDLQ